MIAPSLAQVLDALGGFRPLEADADLSERMRAFEQAARFCLKLKRDSLIGHGHAGTGNLALIAKRDFGLNVAQHRVCLQRAKDFLFAVRPDEEMLRRVAEIKARWETSNVERRTPNIELLQKAA